MHSSTGNNITPATVLKVYEPDMVRWLFAKYAPEAGFAFNFDDTIIRHYSEFDKNLEAYKNGETDEYNTAVFDYCMVSGKQSYSKVPFGVLASVATIVDFNPQSVREMLAKIGVEFSEMDETRLLRVQNWICNHQPSKLFKLLPERNDAYFANMQEDEKVAVSKLCEYLGSVENIEEKEVQAFLYSIINDSNLTKKENTVKQMRFFKVFYNLLFGQDSGPRLYLFLAAVDKSKYLSLLSF
jgi:lysyl-tRNA synthetase class 1